jgi:hypothetical protein
MTPIDETVDVVDCCTPTRRGGTGGGGHPPSTVDSFDTYINICTYSIENINFTLFYKNMMILVKNSIKLFEKLLKHVIIYILSH